MYNVLNSFEKNGFRIDVTEDPTDRNSFLYSGLVYYNNVLIKFILCQDSKDKTIAYANHLVNHHIVRNKRIFIEYKGGSYEYRNLNN